MADKDGGEELSEGDAVSYLFWARQDRVGAKEFNFCWGSGASFPSVRVLKPVRIVEEACHVRPHKAALPPIRTAGGRSPILR